MSSLSVVIPCLNEANTIGSCIRKARIAMEQLQLSFNEIIVADNGSSDGSLEICEAERVNIVHVETRGYGAALDAGIRAAQGDWIIFADADDSYDFADIASFIPLLEQGYELVVGNRFGGTIQKNAMPFLHRYLGTPVISFLGRRSFNVPLNDFNCGMRAIRKAAYLKLGMKSRGMEFASEMIAKAGLNHLKMSEVPVNLYKDGRHRKPHLRTWQDGWKHLRLILLLSPKLLLLYPALCFLILGTLLGGALVFSYVRIYNLVLDIHTLYYASVMFMVGIQLMQFYILARLYGSSMGLYPARKFSNIVYRLLAFERALVAGTFIFLIGIVLTGYAVYQWQQKNFGELDPAYVFRIIIPAGFCISLGMQMIVFGFLLYTFRQFRTD